MSALALASVCAVLVAPPPPSPPSPRAAARAAMKASAAPPARPAPKRGERSWLPTTYSLSRDAGFTPWTSFLSLGDDAIGRWTLEGTSLGAGLRCIDRTHGCVPLAEAILALVWQPHGTPLGVYAGLAVASVPDDGAMRMTAGPTFGLRLRPASLASIVRRARAR